MKNFIKPILAVLIFLFLQVVGSVVGVVYAIATKPELLREAFGDGEGNFETSHFLTSDAIAISLIVSGLLTIICLYAFKFVDRKQVFNISAINGKWAPVVIIGAFLGIFATNLLAEWVDLPNLLEEQFLGMSRTVVGIIAIAILGPLAEELTFREAFIGNLLKGGTKPWVAIFISSLCFGLIHGNPAQIPFAFTIGLVLGIVYYKTGNIVLTSIIHILNNSIAVVEMNVFGAEAADFTYRDMLGIWDIPVIIILAVFCIFILYRFWHQYVPRPAN